MGVFRRGNIRHFEPSLPESPIFAYEDIKGMITIYYFIFIIFFYFDFQISSSQNLRTANCKRTRALHCRNCMHAFLLALFLILSSNNKQFFYFVNFLKKPSFFFGDAVFATGAASDVALCLAIKIFLSQSFLCSSSNLPNTS